MRRLSKNRRIIIGLFIWGVFCAMPFQVLAVTPDIRTLVPNSYQYKEFKENKEVLHDDHRQKRIQLLSDDLKLLTFEKNPYPNHDELKATLFARNVSEHNTIQLKSQKLDLFKEKNNALKDYSYKTDQTEGFTLSLPSLFLGIVIILCLVLFFIVLPKVLVKKKIS